ncbi:kinase-like domain protein [Fusarium beomiforme]|uniref:Kinase-like domain protein n=1 Tax=Fusarium beomiforme TaxID=44412 RepID=A0A9P5DYT3_9HYPO|nr:kinase-like domain protein [Fusarium beomiforme]
MSDSAAPILLRLSYGPFVYLPVSVAGLAALPLVWSEWSEPGMASFAPCILLSWLSGQDDVLSWFSGFSEKLAAFADDRKSVPTHQRRRRPLAKSNEPIDGPVGKRKMDVGFVNDPQAGKDSKCHWSQILVPGELKSNPSADKASEAWLDLGRFAREVLAAQDTRRFVLGFTVETRLLSDFPNVTPFSPCWATDTSGNLYPDVECFILM